MTPLNMETAKADLQEALSYLHFVVGQAMAELDASEAVRNRPWWFIAMLTCDILGHAQRCGKHHPYCPRCGDF